ncbi:hypothetical protein [Blastococcus sp. PRF04-17]|uniref:hypothetical protein n=1 Tax=Blastococcus sp. PRF04-17 TaxID=2933797 RepID=UPI001FF2BB0E|nr:hypothetical protein [Blastococcus sp. PRF04-17]UOY00209.1 hypothetical protein MVA48_14485 [Blastococcus sp. PRF04-17]
MWWHWVVGGLVVWLVVAVLLALVIGRGIRLADRRSPGTGVALTTADLPGAFVAQRPAVAPPRRRAIPLPPVGIALAATAVALETVGFVLRLDGATGPTAQLLSMDAPFSLPRLFVAVLFAAAAVAAVVAAAQAESRRAWWLGVAVVAAGIASVKAGGTVHAEAIGALEDALGAGAAVLLSAVAAVVVVAGLWSFTRTERRDRRRVLGTLGCYAVASVGLSAVSAVVPGGWVATATYVEESAEALAGVAFLIAVLVGVAPRLVLPASWRLRRESDAQTLDVPAASPVAERG